jgi:cell wall-associated NlpC family hydrolase
MIAIALLLILTLTSCSGLKPGDLLFHVVEKGNAITDVTPGMIDHVAIVVSKDSVIEAAPVGKGSTERMADTVTAGVRITAIEALRRQDGYYIIGRVRQADATRSIANARTFLGQSYDHLYLPGNEAIYCSELVQFSFVDAQGNRLFDPIPMSFHDETGHITTYWKTFYEKYDMEVPEGQSGTNPGELSRRKNVRIVGRLQKNTK